MKRANVYLCTPCKYTHQNNSKECKVYILLMEIAVVFKSHTSGLTDS